MGLERRRLLLLRLWRSKDFAFSEGWRLFRIDTILFSIQGTRFISAHVLLEDLGSGVLFYAA